MVFLILKNICYFIIGVASVGSNAILITVLLRYQQLRTTANVFILNLALCDLTTVLTSIPFAVAIEETSSYPFGYLGCKVLMPTATAAINSAALTLLLIAVERFYAVILPIRARLLSFKTKCIVLCVLHGLSILSVIPFIVHQRYSKINGTSSCQEIWPNKEDQPYTLFLFCIQYMIPLTLIIILYSISWNAIRKQNRVIIKMQEQQQKGGRHFSRSNSWDASMWRRHSAVDRTDEDWSRKNFFKSTQLKAVEEAEIDVCSQNKTSPLPREGGKQQPHDNCLSKSNQSQTIKEADDASSFQEAGNTSANAAELNHVNKTVANGNGVGMAVTCQTDEATEGDDRTAQPKNNPPVKKQRLKKISLGWNFKPFTPTESPDSAEAPSQHPLAENGLDLLFAKQNGIKHAESNVEPRGSFQTRMSKAFKFDKEKEKKSYCHVPQHSAANLLRQESGGSHCSSEYFKFPALGTKRHIPHSGSSKLAILQASGSEKSDQSQCSRLGQQDIPQPSNSAAASKVKMGKSSNLLMRPKCNGNTSQNMGSPPQQEEASNADVKLIPSLDKDTRRSSRLSQLSTTALRRLSSVFRGTSEESGDSEESRNLIAAKRVKQTRRTLIMFTCVVVVFAICMLPNQITWLWISFRRERLSQMITTIFYFLTYTNSILNPWIYGAVNPSFRKSYRRLLSCRAEPDMKKQGSSKMSFLATNRFQSEQTLADTVSRRESMEWRRSIYAVKNDLCANRLNLN